MRILSKIFSASGGVIFFIIFLISTFSAAARLNKNGIDLIIVSAAFVIVIAAFSVLYFLLKKYSRKVSHKKIYFIFFTLLIFLTAFEIVLAYRLKYIPISDSLYVDTAAKNFAADGNFTNICKTIENKKFYFSRFPNNWAILIILSFIYRAVYIILGYVPNICSCVISVLCTSFSSAVMFICADKIFQAKKISGRAALMLTSIFLLICPGLILYSQILYTDTLSMPFAALALYFFIKLLEKNGKSAVCAFLSALFIGIGYGIKGSIGVLAAAFVIYSFFALNFRRAAVICAVIALVTIGVNAIFFKTGISLGISSGQLLEKERVPTIHWVMMGAVGNGGFNKNEYAYTISFDSYAKKTAAAVKRLTEHMNNYTPQSFMEHIRSKLAYTWDSGKFYAVHHLSKSENTRIFKQIRSSHSFSLWADSFHIAMLFFVCFSFIAASFSNEPQRMMLIRLAVFGIALFLLIWETRSRYLINFLPFILLTAADGADSFDKLISELKNQLNAKRNIFLLKRI